MNYGPICASLSLPLTRSGSFVLLVQNMQSSSFEKLLPIDLVSRERKWAPGSGSVISESVLGPNPEPSNRATKHRLPFLITYNCGLGFSNLVQVRNRKRDSRAVTTPRTATVTQGLMSEGNCQKRVVSMTRGKQGSFLGLFTKLYLLF